MDIRGDGAGHLRLLAAGAFDALGHADMTPGDVFKQLLVAVKERIGSKGFVRRGSYFYLRELGNWGLLNFQRSTRSTATRIVFTLNLGTCSQEIRNFHYPEEAGKPPRVYDCHWQERIGSLLPDAQDTWWEIDGAADFAALQEAFLEIVENIALPAIGEHIGDDHLKTLWLAGNGTGITEFEMLSNLLVLLRFERDAALFKEVQAKLEAASRGKPTAAMADLIIKRIHE